MHLSRDTSGSHRKGTNIEPDLIQLFLYPTQLIFASILYKSKHNYLRCQALESFPSVDRYSLPGKENVRDSKGMSSSWLLSSL